MSYNFAIVIPPIPADDREAWAAVDELTEVSGEPPPIFRTLHDQLTARYPCLCSLSDDEVDDGVWSDGPLWNNFGERAAILGLSYSHAEEVLPFIIDSSTKLGLCVFDWGTERIFRGNSS